MNSVCRVSDIEESFTKSVLGTAKSRALGGAGCDPLLCSTAGRRGGCCLELSSCLCFGEAHSVKVCSLQEHLVL